MTSETLSLFSHTFFNNNIPPEIFYSSIFSEVLRLDRNTSDHITFIMLVKKI